MYCFDHYGDLPPMFQSDEEPPQLKQEPLEEDQQQPPLQIPRCRRPSYARILRELQEGDDRNKGDMITGTENEMNCQKTQNL